MGTSGGVTDFVPQSGYIVIVPWGRRPDHAARAFGAALGEEGDQKNDDLERRLAQFRVITVPTITMEGDANGALHSEPSIYANKFAGRDEHRTITGGIGRNLPQEALRAFAEAIVNVTEG